MSVRLAIVVSHPINYFVSWYRATHSSTNVDLRVFYCCDWGVQRYKDPEFGMDVEWDTPLLDGYAHEFLPIARRPKRLDFWETDNPLVGQALDRFSPDVVLVHGYARRTNWRATAWARRRQVPVMVYSDAGGSPTQPSFLKRLVKDQILRRFYRSVDGALYVGDNNVAYYRRWGIPDDRLFPGTLPVDTDTLRATAPGRDQARKTICERWGIPADAFIVLFVGKYVGRKRPLDLVKAAAALARAGLPVWAVLVGEGAERAAMEAFCRENAVTNVVLTGFVNQSAIAEYYAASDALAVVSSHDQHPLVVTEAMSFGHPLIVSDWVGCVGDNDTARRGVNALVYPAGDVDALAQAIQSLCQDRVMYRAMSAASMRLALEHTPQAAAQQLADAVARLHMLGCRSSVTQRGMASSS